MRPVTSLAPIINKLTIMIYKQR